MSWHPSDLMWTQMVDQALTIPQRVRLKFHLRRCERCRLQAQALIQERETFTADPLTLRAIAARVAHQEAPSPQLWPWWTRIGLGAAASAAIAILVVTVSSTRDDTFSLKGGDSLELVLKRGHEVMPLGERCLPGDAIRARVRSTRRYVLLISLDATGKVSLLFPSAGQASEPVPAENEFIPGSWELDEVPGRERIIAVFSDAPLEFSSVSEALGKSVAIEGAAIVERSCVKASP